MDIMETEVKFIKERHDQAQRAVRVVGRNCLVMGAVASLMWLALAPGLQIEMLRILHLSALSALYGVVAWAVAILLREVDQRSLVVALVGATTEIREKLTGNMSERVRVFILSETGYVADIGAEKVAGIHGAICNQIVRMSKQGQISLP